MMIPILITRNKGTLIWPGVKKQRVDPESGSALGGEKGKSLQQLTMNEAKKMGGNTTFLEATDFASRDKVFYCLYFTK